MSLNDAIIELNKFQKTNQSLNKEDINNLLKIHSSDLLNSIHKLNNSKGSWKDLKNYSKLAKYYNNHDEYKQIIFNYDRNLDFETINEKFIGKGNGKDNLNSYRVVEFQNNSKKFFEKIYKKDSIRYKRLEFFMEIYDKLIAHDVDVLKIEKIEVGNKLIKIYFEFIENIKPLDKKDIFNKYLDFAKQTSKISLQEFGNKYSFTFKISKIGMQNTKKFLDSKKINFIEKDIKLNNFLQFLPIKYKVFTHGDISLSNITQDNKFLDFDRCRIYPVGYDLAFLCNKYLSVESLKEFKERLSDILKDYSEIDMLSFYYFSFIAYNRDKGVKVSDEFKIELYKELEKYYKKLVNISNFEKNILEVIKENPKWGG